MEVLRQIPKRAVPSFANQFVRSAGEPPSLFELVSPPWRRAAEDEQTRLLAAASWERVLSRRTARTACARLVQLTLIGARLKYQGLGLAHRCAPCCERIDIP